LKLCIAGKNNIAVEAVDYVLKKGLCDKSCLFLVPVQSDEGIDGWQRSLRKYGKENNIMIVQYEDLISKLAKEKDLILISLEFDKILPVKRFASRNLYNIHFSALPKYKGNYTSVWPILNGEKESGVTLHFIDEGVDIGDIIDQIKFSILLEDTARTLYEKYLYYGIELFKQNIEKILLGNITCIPQSAEGSTYYSRSSLDFKKFCLNINKTSFEIQNQIRAFIFPEYQLPVIKGEKIIKSELLPFKHKRAKIVEEDENFFIISGIDRYVVKATKLGKDVKKSAFKHKKSY